MPIQVNPCNFTVTTANFKALAGLMLISSSKDPFKGPKLLQESIALRIEVNNLMSSTSTHSI